MLYRVNCVNIYVVKHAYLISSEIPQQYLILFCSPFLLNLLYSWSFETPKRNGSSASRSTFIMAKEKRDSSDTVEIDDLQYFWAQSRQY